MERKCGPLGEREDLNADVTACPVQAKVDSRRKEEERNFRSLCWAGVSERRRGNSGRPIQAGSFYCGEEKGRKGIRREGTQAERKKERRTQPKGRRDSRQLREGEGSDRSSSSGFLLPRGSLHIAQFETGWCTYTREGTTLHASIVLSRDSFARWKQVSFRARRKDKQILSSNPCPFF